VQPLDCYQNKRRQGDSRTENHSRRRQTHPLHYHNGAVKVTSQHFVLTTHHYWRTYIATSFLKSKALPNRLGKVKTHITKNGTKSQIQKMQSTKFMQWNRKLKAILPIKLIITKQLKLARLATSTNSNW